MIKLSILICSLESRSVQLYSLLDEIYKQIGEHKSYLEVEVLVNLDNKQKTTGKKRQELLEQAKGEYIVFIDDDDEIYYNYLKYILAATGSGADCIGTWGHYSIDGRDKILWKLSKDYDDHDKDGILYRRTNHISPVKRKHALLAGFPDKSNAEDKWYSERLNPYLKTEAKIDEPIYHYRYSSQNKEYV